MISLLFLFLTIVAGCSCNQTDVVSSKVDHPFSTAWKFEAVFGVVGTFLNAFVFFMFFRFNQKIQHLPVKQNCFCLQWTKKFGYIHQCNDSVSEIILHLQLLVFRSMDTLYRLLNSSLFIPLKSYLMSQDESIYFSSRWVCHTSLCFLFYHCH